MIEFNLPAMSCGHCVSSVTEAVKQVDPDAKVDVDLATKRVKVETSQPREPIAEALTDAGYPPA
jgi:copper chaperone